MNIKDIFGKSRKNKEKEWNDEWNIDRFWMPEEGRWRHQPFQWRANEKQPLKLGYFVSNLFDIRKVEVALLTISDGTSVSRIESREEIWDYNILSVYINRLNSSFQGANADGHSVIITLNYRTFNTQKEDKDKSILKRQSTLIIHLNTSGGIKKKVIYVIATFLQPPTQYEQGVNKHLTTNSFLIAYDFRPEKETAKEFDEVFNSMLNKINSNKKSNEITLLEHDLLDLIAGQSSHIVRNYYHGLKLMEQNRFWDAIGYLESAYNELQEKWWKSNCLQEEEHRLFFETSFQIGYCYMELGFPEKAYKYLELPFNHDNNNSNYFTEYVNCLSAMNDIRMTFIIDLRIEEFQKETANNDFSDNEATIYRFCYRRKAYNLIEQGHYDDARELLNSILDAEPDNQFAKGELDYIEKISKNNNAK
jgi:tetratricopeptide (TPR) repeat protein